MPIKKRLYTPGPTTVPERVLSVLGSQVIHHRAPEFIEMFKKINEDLKYLFQTSQPVMTVCGSGTAGMEAIVANLVRKESKPLVVPMGKFGERWAELCEAYGVKPIVCNIEWGKAPTAADLRKALSENPGVDIVFLTQSETSTGVVCNLKELVPVAHEKGALVAVDGITGIGAHEFYFDEWGIDAVVTGSQKGVMLPPGLALITLSKNAVAACEKGNLPRYYFDLRKAYKDVQKEQTPYTPAIGLIMGLGEALKMVREEGIENVWKRHQQNGDATRAAIKALNLELFANPPSNVVSAFRVPAGLKAKDITSSMMKEHGMRIMAGQAELEDKIIRVSHLGYIDRFDIVSMVAALESVLIKLGHKCELGAGLKAVQQVFK